jgi:hypothetical protein
MSATNTVQQNAFQKFLKDNHLKRMEHDEIYLAGWDARDAHLCAIIWEDKEVDMTDTFEVMLSAFTNGYARGIKEKTKLWNSIIDLFSRKDVLKYIDRKDILDILETNKEELLK